VSIDYTALLGLTAGIQVAKGDYDAVRDGLAIGSHPTNTPVLPQGALILGMATHTTEAFTYDGGAGAGDLYLGDVALGPWYDTLNRVDLLWNSATNFPLVPADRAVTAVVYDFPVLTGKVDYFVLYIT